MKTQRHNLSALIKDEVVKRFEDVVREEIRQHNIALVKTDKEIAFLKALFADFKTQHEEFKNQNAVMYQDVRVEFRKTVDELNHSFSDQRRFIIDHAKKINDIADELKTDMSRLVSVSELDDVKNTNTEYKEEILSALLKSEELLANYIHKQSERLLSAIADNEERWRKEQRQILERIETLEHALAANIVDAKGVTRELNVIKKSATIQESLNQYFKTRLDRINKED